jgi:hypothetical protein
MSLYNWIWDLDQESKISALVEKVETLEQKVANLENWIRYLMKDNDEFSRAVCEQQSDKEVEVRR